MTGSNDEVGLGGVPKTRELISGEARMLDPGAVRATDLYGSENEFAAPGLKRFGPEPEVTSGDPKFIGPPRPSPTPVEGTL